MPRSSQILLLFKYLCPNKADGHPAFGSMTQIPCCGERSRPQRAAPVCSGYVAVARPKVLPHASSTTTNITNSILKNIPHFPTTEYLAESWHSGNSVRISKIQCFVFVSAFRQNNGKLVQ